MSSVAEAVKKAEKKSNKSISDVVASDQDTDLDTQTIFKGKFQEILDGVPDNTKYNILNSLVGALNCSVIGSANIMVGRLERLVPEFETLSALEVIHMVMEADMRYDNLRAIRGLCKVRDKLRDQLIEVANDNDISDWTSSIEFMTQPSQTSRLSKEKLGQVLSLIGLDEATIEIMYQASLVQESQDRERSAEQISQRAGRIEWVIEKVYYSNQYRNELGHMVDDNDIPSSVEELNPEAQNRLYDKLVQALNKGLTRCASRFAQGDSRYELNDVVILNQLIKEAKKLEVFEAD
jgi:hypothetical protein